MVVVALIMGRRLWCGGRAAVLAGSGLSVASGMWGWRWAWLCSAPSFWLLLHPAFLGFPPLRSPAPGDAHDLARCRAGALLRRGASSVAIDRAGERRRETGLAAVMACLLLRPGGPRCTLARALKEADGGERAAGGRRRGGPPEGGGGRAGSAVER